MKLRTWLWEQKMTIGKFAAKTRYNRTYLSLIISGKAIPGRKCAEDIERITEGYITAEELLAGKVKKGVEK